MIRLKQQIKTVKSLGESDPERTLEMLLYLSGVTVIIVISPLLSLISESFTIPILSLFSGFAAVLISEFIPEKISLRDQANKYLDYFITASIILPSVLTIGVFATGLGMNDMNSETIRGLIFITIALYLPPFGYAFMQKSLSMSDNIEDKPYKLPSNLFKLGLILILISLILATGGLFHIV